MPIRRDLLLSTLTILLVWLAARVYVYEEVWQHQNIPALHLDKDTGYLWYYPVNFIKDNFIKSFFYLRGQPPLPQLLMAIMVKISGWPFNKPIDSFFLGLLTLFSALIIREIIVISGRSLLIATSVAALWTISTDCIAFEIDGWTRGFYETLTGFLFILSVWLFHKAETKNKASLALLFSICAALLIMSRATLSYFFIIPLIAVLLLNCNRKIVICIIPLAIQLGWGIKNLYAFGQFQFGTSSFAGTNIQIPLFKLDPKINLAVYAINNLEKKDTCALQVVAALTTSSQQPAEIINTVPHECRGYLLHINQMEETLQKNIDPEEKTTAGYNSHWDYAITKEALPAYISYIYHNPTTLFRILQKSLPIFWLPAEDGVSNYGAEKFTTPFFNAVRKSISLIVEFNKVFVYSLSSVTFIILIACPRHKNPQKKSFLYAFSCFLYMSFFCCIGDLGENNRYRFAIEPVIWVLPFLTIPNLLALLKDQKND